MVVLPNPAFAQEPNLAKTATQTAYKAVTYQALSSLNDFVYGAVIGGGAAVGGALAIASAVTEPIVFYAHEMVWDRLGPEAQNDKDDLILEKTATYVTVGMGRSFVMAWGITGDPSIAAGYVAINAIGDAASYLLNESLWSYIDPYKVSPAPAPAVLPEALSVR